VKLLNEVAQKKLKRYKHEFDEKGKIIAVKKKGKIKQYEKNLTEHTIKRFDYIYNSLSMGNSRQITISNFMKDHDCSMLVARNWYTSALKYLKTSNEDEKEFVREKYEMMLMNLFQQAVELGDRNEAHKLLQTLIKLNGVNDVEKKQITNTFEFKFNTAAPNNQRIDIQAQDINYQNIEEEEEEIDDEE